MMNRRNEILEGAIRVFSRKGFYCSTMQDVAEACGMSKATLYQHFKSKEKLLLSIFQAYDQLFYQKLTAIFSNELLTPYERLIKQIEIQLNDALSHRDFIRMLMLESPNLYNEEIRNYSNDMKSTVIEHYRKSLIATYGEKIIPYSYDLVYCTIGILDQYYALLIVEDVQLPVSELSSYILKLVDALAEGFIGRSIKPILTEDLLPGYLRNVDIGEIPLSPETLISQMYGVMEALEDHGAYDQDARESIRMLHEELKTNAPRRIIIQGMLRNLEAFPALKDLVDRFSRFEQIKAYLS